MAGSSDEQIHSLKWKYSGIVFITVYCLMLLYWMFIGFGRSRHPGSPLSYNVIPLETIGIYLNYGWKMPSRVWIVNLIGNIAVFVPIGLVLPMIMKRFRSWLRITIAFLPGILVLETMQMLLRVGSFDVDDVILNTLGIWIGWFMFFLGEALTRRNR